MVLGLPDALCVVAVMRKPCKEQTGLLDALYVVAVVGKALQGTNMSPLTLRSDISVA